MNDEEIANKVKGDFVTNLILIEEMRRDNVQDTVVEAEEQEERVFFLQQKNVIKNTQFTPEPSDTDQDTLPIHGNGEMHNFLAVADSPNFDVTIYVDDRYVVDDSYANLSSISDELEHVSAYDTPSGSYVVGVSGYTFTEMFDADIRAREPIEFSVVRVEGTVNE